MAKAPKAIKETTEKAPVAENVTVVNIGLALIFIDGARVMPGEEIEISAERLATSGVEYLFGQGALEVKDDSRMTKAIVAKLRDRKKKDPDAGKTLKQLEDGGEF